MGEGRWLCSLINGGSTCIACCLPSASCLHMSLPPASCLHMSLPSASCLHMSLPPASCLHMSLPSASCLHMSLPPASCLHMSLPSASCLHRCVSVTPRCAAGRSLRSGRAIPASCRNVAPTQNCQPPLPLTTTSTRSSKGLGTRGQTLH